MKRIVIKVGTAVVSRPDGRLALGRVGALVEQLAERIEAGDQVLLVSSGAVGLGAGRLKISKPTLLADRQAAAAVGQGALMALYDGQFRLHGHTVAQVLLTESDLHHRQAYVNVAAALERLLQLHVVPIINENDVVSTAELALCGQVFGDNDHLAALVGSNIGADVLLLLSDVDAVYTAPPGSPGAERIPVFRSDTIDTGKVSALGTGGMHSKIAAAKIASQSGVRTVIASGSAPDIIRRVLDKEDVGTVFEPRPGMNRRRRWIAFATAPSGSLVVNEGAAAAITERHASLLAPGVTEVLGDFDSGEVVRILHNNIPIAKGIVTRNSHSICAGTPARGVLVHRDDIALLELS